MALTRCLAMDCEMVGTGPKGRIAILARVSIVNEYGDCVYDEYVSPNVKVTNYRTWISGITREDLVNGLDFAEVREAVRQIIKSRVVVGHSLEHDFQVLKLTHPPCRIRDTSKYPPFIMMNCDRIPSLRWLAHRILGMDIQNGSHSSVEDASAAMHVYRAYEEQWEKWLRSIK